MTDKVGLHAYVSKTGRDALEEFSYEKGVTYSGLIEALTEAIIDGEDLEFLVTRGRRVDADRRRR